MMNHEKGTVVSSKPAVRERDGVSNNDKLS